MANPEFMLKYSLTKEQLTDRQGRHITDAILTKAEKFLSLGLVELHGNGWDWDIYIVKPIIGYNRHTYTVYIKTDTVLCDCQYAQYGRLCSHALAALLQSGQWQGGRITAGGHVNHNIPKRALPAK